jgi:hypothetical protein
VIHGVHADVVHAARQLLDGSGSARAAIPEESPPFGGGLGLGAGLPPGIGGS